MNILVSHPTGNRNVRAIVSALHKAGMLAKFGTTISIKYNSPFLKLLPLAIKNELLRRNFEIPHELIWSHPMRESCRMLATKIGLKSLTRHEEGWASIDAVYQNIDSAIGKNMPLFYHRKKISAVYCYEDGAFETFQAAGKYGLSCIYDLPIAYWQVSQKLLKEEAKRLPEWEETLIGIKDSTAKLERKERELELADIVIVPGKFVMDSLPDWTNRKKIILSPFGSPLAKIYPSENFQKLNHTRPLRVLFVGSMGQRKGLADLFDAVRMIKSKNIELVVMGSPLVSFGFYRAKLSNFVYEGGRPYEQVLELMNSCDLLCLPSIVEGRALVMQEAMSQKLPIIITPNTGGEDLVIEGQTGFLVPIRSPQAIAEKLVWFLEHRQEAVEMGRMAQQHAATHTWEKYGETIVRAIADLLN